MGEKKIKAWDFCCKACGRKFLMENLENDGYVDTIKLGKVVYCPCCDKEEYIPM